MSAFSLIDTCLVEIDTAIRTLIPPQHRGSRRDVPGQGLDEEAVLTPEQKAHSAGLMRVNHAGEVCAQGLYQGQALTAQLTKVRSQMEAAAAEEVDHLAWCEQRLRELDSRPSLLNPVWYLGSLMLGAIAGMAGDRWSLGFVAETELQVSAHLQSHLEKLPASDEKTRLILEKMQEDEMHHADMAKEAGAADLPMVIKGLMGAVSTIMTKTSYYL